MKFAAPQWLWVLAVIPLVFAWALWDQKRRREKLARFVAESLWPVVLPELDPKARFRKLLVWMLACVFLALALARPQWGTREETSSVTGLDVMLVLDVSNSMETEDVAPSRIRKAKHLLRGLVERLRGDRVGLVGFAGSAYTASPLTTDADYLLETLDLLGARSVSAQGTDIGLGLQAARTALDRGAEEGGKSRDRSNSSQAVVLVSDGEDHEDAALESAAKLKAAGVRLYVLGIGTRKGGPVPLRDESGQLKGYKRARNGETVVSTFKPDALMKLADTAGGRYWNVSPSEAELEEILRDLGALNRGELAERKYIVFEERYQIPLLIAVILLLLEMSLGARNTKRARPAMVFAMLSLLGQTGCYSGGAYFDNEKALKALKDGKMDEARQYLGQAQAKNPESPALSYNLGDLQVATQDAAAADKSFEEAAKSAEAKRNWDIAGKARFNQGVVRGGSGDVRGAVEAYLRAIENARQAGDEQLERDARKNIELLLEQQKKSQQQKKDQQKDQSQQDKQKQDQDQESKGGKSEQDKKNEQDKEDKQDKDKKDQQGKKDQAFEDPKKSRERFRSQKYTAEDAERVMAELKNKERELQKRMRHQNGRPQSPDKDW